MSKSICFFRPHSSFPKFKYYNTIVSCIKSKTFELRKLQEVKFRLFNCKQFTKTSQVFRWRNKTAIYFA